MKIRVLLGFLAVLLLAGSCFADEVYTFSFTDSSNSAYDFTFSITSPTFITSQQTLSLSPITLANGLTLTQGLLSFLYNGDPIFEFGTSNTTLLSEGFGFGAGGPSEGIGFIFSSVPNSDGTYIPADIWVTGNNPYAYNESGSGSLTIVSTPEPSSLSLVGLGILALVSLSIKKALA